jgi:hypothetical protein
MADFPAALSHGPLTRVADGIFAVRGGFRMGPGVTISRTMTVVDTGSGLVVLNAVRLSDAAQAELDRMGKVTALIKLSDSHGIDEPFYVDRYSPMVWSLPGARLGALAAGKVLAGEGPVAGGAVVDFAGAKGWREAAYFVPFGGGTLVTCDAIQHCVDTEGASFGGRLTSSLMGFKGGVIVPSMWRRFQKVSGPRVRETLFDLTKLAFTNLITGHGPAVAGGADTLVRAAIESASA